MTRSGPWWGKVKQVKKDSGDSCEVLVSLRCKNNVVLESVIVRRRKETRMTTARATMVTLVIAVVPRRPQCWRPGIPIGTRGTHKYPAGHGGAEGRGYLLGGGKASGAVIWLVMVCHRHGFPGGPLKPFVPTIGIPWHLRPSGCGGNKKNIRTESSI